VFVFTADLFPAKSSLFVAFQVARVPRRAAEISVSAMTKCDAGISNIDESPLAPLYLRHPEVRA
jgi:hypothetical protein